MAQKTMTAHGDAQIDTAQYKVGLSSGLFDGTAYIEAPDSPDWDILNGDFSIDFWFRSNGAWSGDRGFMQQGDSVNNEMWNIQFASSDNSLILYAYSDSSTPKYRVKMGLAYTFSADTWYHVGFCRTSGVGQVFINGVSQGLDWNTWNSVPDYALPMRIGYSDWSVGGIVGWMDEVRISKGVNLLGTADFKPFTVPYGYSSYNGLLLHCEGTDASTTFTDSSADTSTRTAKPITSVGGAKVDTAQFKFGNASLLLDGGTAPGATQWLSTPNNKDFDFGANDFTLEGWVRFAATTNNQIFYNKRAAGAGTKSFTFQYTGGNLVFAYTTDGTTMVDNSYAWTPSTGTWYHIAVSRSGNDLKAFVDGSQVGSTTDMTGITIYTSTTEVAIGGYNVVADTVNGWLDELRVSNNARYTANFTKPSAIFTNDTNTLLLIHCDGIDDATQFADTNSTGSKLIRVVTVGGGGGGGNDAGGGGGAGGVVYHPDYAVNSGVTYTVTVGAGGAGGATGGNNGSNGDNSVFSTMVAAGGGGGAHALFAGNPGGCGGGGAYNAKAGGLSLQGNSNGVSYGFAGGNGNASTSNNGGGGGGAGAVGTTSVDTKDANGGIGVADADVGNLLSIASAPDTDHTAGGGGGYGTTNYGFGGNGGGGRSASFPQSPNTPLPGTTNTGGGGGNGWDSVGGVQTDSLGGSGIVIVLYTTTDFTSHVGGNATGTSGAFTWVKFTSSGTLLLGSGASPLPTFFNIL